jgi:hypothetical protein
MMTIDTLPVSKIMKTPRLIFLVTVKRIGLSPRNNTHRRRTSLGEIKDVCPDRRLVPKLEVFDSSLLSDYQEKFLLANKEEDSFFPSGLHSKLGFFLAALSLFTASGMRF